MNWLPSSAGNLGQREWERGLKEEADAFTFAQTRNVEANLAHKGLRAAGSQLL